MGNILRKLFPKLSFRLRYLKGKDRWSIDHPSRQLLNLLQKLPPGKALDLGCGLGQVAITMAQYGWVTTGIDFVPEVIKVCQKKALAANLEIDFQVGDVSKLSDLMGPFDLVTDIGCYHSLSPQKRVQYRKNLMDILADGGIYLLYAFNQPEAIQPPGITEKDLDALAQLLELSYKEEVVSRGGRPAFWVRFTRPRFPRTKV